MGKLSVYAVDKIFDHIFKVAAYKRPKVTGTDIAFVDGGEGEDTITSVAEAFGDFTTGDVVIISGAAEPGNNGTFVLTGASASTLNVATGSLTAELATAEVTIQTSIYVALFDGDPEGAGVECSGATYERQICNTWSEAASRANSNGVKITFAEAGDDWSTCDYVALMDKPTGGNVLGKDDITEITINEGDDLYIDIGDIDVSWASGGICNTWAIKTLDHIFKNTPITVPTNLYVGYSTADPTDDASGLAEPVANGYARKLMNTWNIAAAKLTDNDGAILFDACSTAPHGTITHFIISDHITEVGVANIIIYAALTAPVIIGIGDQLNFPDETLEIEADSGV